MAGLPGTGKSTLGYALAKIFDWIVIDKDLIHSAMMSMGSGKLDTTPAAYETALSLLEDLIVKQNKSVILDTAGREPFILERAKEIAAQCEARLRIIRCIAPKDVRMTRLSTRNRRASQWATDIASEEEQEAWYAHLPVESLVIQTEGPLELYLDTAVRFLNDE